MVYPRMWVLHFYNDFVWCNTCINPKSPCLKWFGVPKTNIYFHDSHVGSELNNGYVLCNTFTWVSMKMIQFLFMVVSWKHSPNVQYPFGFKRMETPITQYLFSNLYVGITSFIKMRKCFLWPICRYYTQFQEPNVY